MSHLSKPFLLWAVFLLLSACDGAGDAPPAADSSDVDISTGTETSKDFGDFVVHYNALSTDQLTPDIASQYGIVRSKNRAMLTVSILQKEAGGGTSAVPGSVAATSINLTGQFRKIPMREIREQDAIYYIGETAITNAETLIFTIDVTPINDPSRYTVRFMKQFFVD